MDKHIKTNSFLVFDRMLFFSIILFSLIFQTSVIYYLDLYLAKVDAATALLRESWCYVIDLCKVSEGTYFGGTESAAFKELAPDWLNQSYIINTIIPICLSKCLYH